ncbi:MAG: tetratricopeptide repeat protein [Xanthobacteraceae bacterium]
MSEATEFDGTYFQTTDGDIAVINLESARRRSWSRFYQDPMREGIAETVVEHEQLSAQFTGDLTALDRLEFLAKQLSQTDSASVRTALIEAQITSMMHRFTEARQHLEQAEIRGAQEADVTRLRLSIDQACGTDLDRVLAERRKTVAKSGAIEDQVALGGLLADLREFSDADRVYSQALGSYRDVSPFPVAWVCFQLGVLWGELVPEPQVSCAAEWYEKTLERLPSYTKARVHLAETYLSCGRADDAESVLLPALSSSDPEVHWRLADIMTAQGKDAVAQMRAARSGFDAILERHLLAFTDHGAEFYAGSGNDCRRALELALFNVANRPTLRAFEQAHNIAVSAGDTNAAASLLGSAIERWGDTVGFKSSSLAAYRLAKQKGVAA